VIRKATFVLVGGLLLAIPFLVSSNYLLRLVNLALIFSLLAVSLNIVLGYAGQLALGHAALFGIGAYTAALLTAGGSGVLFWPAFVAAGMTTGVAGLLIGIPTLRLRGHYLALATLGFGEIMRHIFFNWREVTHGMDGIAGIPAPSLGFLQLATDRSFFYLALGVLAVVMVATIRMERSKYGRQLAAIRDAELAAGTTGVNVSGLKIIAFAISAVVAGLAGSLYAHLMTFISPDVFVFDLTAQTLSMVLVGGIGTSWGPILGGVMLTFLPEMLRVSKAYYQLIYGAGIALLVIFLPMGLFGLIRRWAPSRTAAAAEETGSGAAADKDNLAPLALQAPRDGSQPAQRADTGAPRDTLLETRALTCRFGGVVAIDALELSIERETIHALIGPNGSGKSTFINLATGIYRPASGSILFDGEPIEALKPWTIANRGVARTFQNLKLFNRLTVLENVLVASRANIVAGWTGIFLNTSRARAEEAALHRAAEEALGFVGLTHLRHQPVVQLPHELQRLVEIARALAMRPKLVLLDEPAAGMNAVEVERLVDCITAMRNRGVTVLLVEHNMPFVMRLADSITVLNFGRKIAEGDAASVRNDPEVIRAYLGTRQSRKRNEHASA
jgi:branched-chain amino acid transport system permease protein